MAPIIKVSEDVLKTLNPDVYEVVDNNVDLSFVTDENLYKEIVRYSDKTFPDHKDDLTKKLSFKDGVMKGNNSYISTMVDMYCKSNGLKERVATQMDLETNIEMFKGFYVDNGLALRTLNGVNEEKAIYLFEQLKRKGISENNFPLYIALRGLRLDDNLNFNLTEESYWKTEKCLNWENQTKFSETKNGFPKQKDKNGSRRILTRQGGLSGVYLSGASNLVMDGSGLASSGGSGGVVFAKGIGTIGNL